MAVFLLAVGCLIHPLGVMAGSDPIEPPGAGTEADPYRISQLGHLAWMGFNADTSAGKYYALQNDIDASETADWHSGAGFYPIGRSATPFLGFFAGQHKEIRNLVSKRPGEHFTGFFGYVGSGGVVENLGLSGGAVTGASYVGAMAGYNAGTIRGCHAAKAVGGGGSVGGLVGLNQEGVVSNCFATGDVNGSTIYAGGLVGGNDQGSGIIIECYARGRVTGVTYVGGLVGANSNGGRVENAYATGLTTGSSDVGGLAGYNDSAVVGSFWDTNATGQAVSAGGLPRSTAEMQQLATYAGWDFANAWTLEEGAAYPVFGIAAQTPAGTGTELDPYQVSELAHLVWMAENIVLSSGQYYLLQNDIDASPAAFWNNGAGLAPIGNGAGSGFAGVFDGNGYAVSGLTIYRPEQSEVGLFGFVDDGGMVKNLELHGGALTGAGYVGALAGWNRGTVRECFASADVKGTYDVGGVVGLNQTEGTVAMCSSTGSLAGNAYVGGLVGENSGLVDRSSAAGPVTGRNRTGGLAGANSGLMSACYATGVVMGYDTAGGLVGMNFGIVSNCYAASPVTAVFYAGGLAGVSTGGGTADRSYWDTNRSDLALSAGGMGKSTDDMKQQATFEGWDFTNVWRITEGVTYPLLVEPARIIGLVGSLAFGNVTVGETAFLDMMITNGGNMALAVTGITYPAGFSGDWNGTIEAGGSHVVQVTFSPVAEQVYDGAVSVRSDRTAGDNTIGISGTGVPVPSPGQICLSAGAYTAQEGVKRKILVKRVNGSNGTVSVTYLLKPKTALAGRDYIVKTGTLTWTDGQTADKVLKLVVPVDGKREGNETFLIVLKNPVGATLAAPAKATITILGNNKGVSPAADAATLRAAALAEALDSLR